jgi:hypothetical protein
VQTPKNPRNNHPNKPRNNKHPHQRHLHLQQQNKHHLQNHHAQRKPQTNTTKNHTATPGNRMHNTINTAKITKETKEPAGLTEGGKK